MKHAFKQDGPYAEWPVEAPVSRNFDCEIVAPSGGVDGSRNNFDARLKLRANTHVAGMKRECFLTIVLRSENDEQRRMTNLERWAPVKELVEQFPELCVWTDAGAPRCGTWRRYLLEVEKAHTALEILGWELTAEEQAIMDAADDYARQAPARYVTAA